MGMIGKSLNRKRAQKEMPCRRQSPTADVTGCDNLVAMHTGAGAIRSLFLDGPVGQLEAILNLGTEKATHSALVCHPHPVYGGTLHNKVVFHAMKALNGFGFP